MTRLLAVALVLAGGAHLVAADGPTPVVGVGLVSVDQTAVFVSARAGGVEALDLTTGKVQWTNKDAGKPVGGSDKLVFAWVGGGPKKAHTFRVLALDATTGKEVGKSDPIEMPDWATTEKVGGRTFRVAARADGAGGAVVAWEAGAFYFGGAAPTEEILAAAKKDAGAVVSVNFDTGKLTVTKDKPKDDDFKSAPGGDFNNKVGVFDFSVDEEIPDKPGTTRVRLTVRKDKKVVWIRDLAGNPWNPPPP